MSIQWIFGGTAALRLIVAIFLLSVGHTAMGSPYVQVTAYSGCASNMGDMGELTSSTGPVSGVYQCTQQNLGSGEVYANFGGVVGSLVTGGNNTAVTDIFDGLNIDSTNLPAGTPVELTFQVFDLNYYIQYAIPPNGGYGWVGLFFGIDANGEELCTACTGNPLNLVNDGTTTLFGLGVTAVGVLNSLPYTTTVGADLSFSLSFSNSVLDSGCAILSSGCYVTSAFNDPVLYIQATDPTTGEPLSSITITGDSGITYPVNTSPVPEVSTVTSTSLALVLLGIFRVAPKTGGARRPSREAATI